MEEKLITVKEYSQLKGCSLTATYKRLKTGLKPYLVEIEGIKYLKAEILEKEGLSRTNEGLKTGLIQDDTSAIKVLKELIADNEEMRLNKPFKTTPIEEKKENETINILREELKSKNKVIENLLDEIKGLNKEIQRLNGEVQRLNTTVIDDNKRFADLAEQSHQLIHQSQILNKNNQVLLSQQIEQPIEEKKEEVENSFKPLWKRIFNKK